MTAPLTGRLTAILLASASLTLPGCVAALVPIAAAGAMGGKQVIGGGSPDNAAATDKEAAKAERRAEKAATKAARNDDSPVRAPVKAMIVPSAAPASPAEATVPGGMQYLYASGEAAAVSLQAYYELMNYLLAISSERSIGHQVQSVVLASDATLAATKFEPCGTKPLAMVLDIDETSLLNTGFEGDQIAQGGAYDQARWNAWENSAAATQVAPVPGVLSAISVARGANVTVVFNSNRQAASADKTAALLSATGFGVVVHGDTLWLQGDGGSGSGKDARRAAIAAKYCVVAMVGDQLGDFSDMFNAPGLSVGERRQLVGSRDILGLWGHGWFMLPNPVYGTGVKGGMADVFPPAGRWTPPTNTPEEAK